MLREVLDHAGARFDEVMGAAIFHRSASSRSRSRSESLGHAERMAALAALAAVYDRPEHYDRAGAFFAPPRRIEPAARPVRAIRGGAVSDWSWPSGFEPHSGDIAEAYSS